MAALREQSIALETVLRESTEQVSASATPIKSSSNPAWKSCARWPAGWWKNPRTEQAESLAGGRSSDATHSRRRAARHGMFARWSN